MAYILDSFYSLIAHKSEWVMYSCNREQADF